MTKPTNSNDTIACDMSAIPADERDAHIALARSLFFAGGRAVRETEDGLMVDLPPDLLGDVARFVENERRCCCHLAFALEVPPHGADLVLRVTGPGARDELLALAQSRPGATAAEAST
jgi:hypothetical protein